MRVERSVIVKIVVSAALVFLVARGLKLQGVAHRLGAADPLYVVAAMALLAIQVLLLTLRWSATANVCELDLPFRRSLRLSLISMLFNQLPAGAMGGDAARVYMAGEPTGRFREALASVLVDRMFAVAVLAAMALAAAPWMFAHVAEVRLIYVTILASVGLLAGMAAFLTCGKFALRLVRVPRLEEALAAILLGARAVFARPATAAYVIGLSGFMHITSGLIVVTLAGALGLSLPVSAGVILTLPGILATIIPLSLGGWGFREGALVIALSQAGLSPEDAFSVSLLFGLLFTVAGLPGAFLMLRGGRAGRRAPHAAQGAGTAGAGQ